MSDTFVPFGVKNAATKTNDSFRAKIIPAQNAGDVPFRAITTSSGMAGAHTDSHGQPHVSVIRDGDKITTIRVVCGCGEVMELRCAY